jgi:AGZA family xanthine/uracil permease-like MFS transporter
MPFTYSIADGIGAGFISYCALKALRGKSAELHPLLVGASIAFLVYFALG